MHLQLTQWEKYFPDIGNNRSLPAAQRVYLEVERGLSSRARDGFYRALADVFATAETEGFLHRLAAVLSTHVRFGSEPLKHEGGEVATLEQYVELVFDLGHQRYTDDLLGLVRRANSFGKQDADFFERPSGTAPGTSDGLSPATV
jgi:hypothetical protein